MVVKPKESKTAMVCAVCKEEFTGKKCPQCGNGAGNLELAKDGIPKQTHSESATFGSAVSLRPTDMALNQEYEMAEQLAATQQLEMHDNLRETYLIRSELKKIELEDKLNQKKVQFAPPPQPQQQAPQLEPQQMQMPNPFQQQGLGPQAMFMNQFMKMTLEDRTEFLDQLSEADPAAMATLSGFFQQQPQPMMQQPMANPYMQQQMNPYMQMPPPWMQQPQYEPQAPVEDPTTVALTIVDKLQDMSTRSQQSGSSEESQVVALLREELRATNERLSAMTQDTRNIENEAVLMELGELRAQISTPREGNTLKDQIHSIKEMVTDLQDIGMMHKPESTNTVEEQIQLSQAHHNIAKEDREMELKKLEMKAQEAKSAMNKNLVSGLFNRQLQKSIQPSTETPPGAIPQHQAVSTGPMNSIVYPPQKPNVVVGELISDAGVVRETREPVRKVAEE
ncbi:MAG: hypothetical protein ACTSPB_16325 [Candidatus Thorarchaeota archaeon]